MKETIEYENSMSQPMVDNGQTKYITIVSHIQKLVSRRISSLLQLTDEYVRMLMAKRDTLEYYSLSP